jgi:hypothetical protein
MYLFIGAGVWTLGLHILISYSATELYPQACKYSLDSYYYQNCAQP